MSTPYYQPPDQDFGLGKCDCGAFAIVKLNNNVPACHRCYEAGLSSTSARIRNAFSDAIKQAQDGAT